MARQVGRLVAPDAPQHTTTTGATHLGTACLVPVLLDYAGNVCQLLSTYEEALERARSLSRPELASHGGLLCRDELSPAERGLGGLGGLEAVPTGCEECRRGPCTIDLMPGEECPCGCGCVGPPEEVDVITARPSGLVVLRRFPSKPKRRR
jgi:hypothetical protein